jgi:hypothetical protein
MVEGIALVLPERELGHANAEGVITCLIHSELARVGLEQIIEVIGRSL